ncbi:MAG TPA: peptide chain release factor 1 [Clostridiaceae bacterium]|nr:peptide chain release factor 1 [Clostridiaceae bacterium]
MANDRDKRLDASVSRYEELNTLLADTDIMKDQEKYLALVQEHAALSDLVADIRESRKLKAELEENRVLLTESDDADFRELVREDINRAEDLLVNIEARIENTIAPSDPNDNRNVIMEIRAGAGGDEAALFAGTLYNMYTSYAENQGWQYEIISSNETGLGGFKEVVFQIEGKGAFSRFKYESGVHRVQRVPVTESGGRVHTSTVTVAVLPEAEDVEFNIDPADLQVDTYRASGAGGQHVNKTSSAIRITHLPTGTVVTCQDQRSQHKNRDKAMRHLRSILLEEEKSRQAADIASERRDQVGTGDRSERIRTYNYSQGRVTDHRIGLSLYNLEGILNGDIDELIAGLNAAAHEAKVRGDNL